METSTSKRGRTHNAQGTREAILNAAEEVFAEHGFDGARVDTIAQVSGYNKSLIFQYFGDKLRLYLEVIRRADAQTRDMQTQAIRSLTEGDSALTPEQVASLLEQFVGQVFDHFMESPLVTRIFLWEMAEGWQTYEKIASHLDTSSIEVLKPLMSRIKEAGLLRSDFDPVIQIVMADLAPLLFLACVPLFRMFFSSADLSSPEAMARARSFVVDFVAGGLLANLPAKVEGS